MRRRVGARDSGVQAILGRDISQGSARPVLCRDVAMYGGVRFFVCSGGPSATHAHLASSVGGTQFVPGIDASPSSSEHVSIAETICACRIRRCQCVVFTEESKK